MSDSAARWRQLYMNAAGSSQPYITLNTSTNSAGERETSFDPKRVSWEDLAKLYADDDLLRTLFSMMGEWSKSSPYDYFIKLDPTALGLSGSWSGTLTSTGTTTNTVRYGSSTAAGTHAGTSAGSGTSVSGHDPNRYQSGDILRKLQRVSIDSISITAPADGPISTSISMKTDET